MVDFTDDQIKAALIRNNGWNGVGVRNTPPQDLTYSFTIIRNMIVNLLFLIFSLFHSPNSFAEIQPELVFELKSIGVMQKPIYVIKIYADGKIHYQGFNAAVNGDRYGQITRKQLDDFTLYFFSLPFEAFKKAEIKKGFERWHKIIDYKSFYSRIYIDDTIFFYVLIKKLDELTNLRQWICFPKSHPNYDDYCMGGNIPVNLNDLKNFYRVR